MARHASITAAYPATANTVHWMASPMRSVCPIDPIHDRSVGNAPASPDHDHPISGGSTRGAGLPVTSPPTL